MTPIKHLNQQMSEYFKLLAPHQKEGNVHLKMSFSRGYWWCENDRKIQKYEREFLSMAKEVEFWIRLLKRTRSPLSQQNILHLLGWAKERTLAGDTLSRYVFCDDVSVSNAALRALFPLVTTRKYSLDIKKVLALLHRPALLSKNKALGLLAFWPEKELWDFPPHELEYITKLSTHKNTLLISNPARMAVERILGVQ